MTDDAESTTVPFDAQSAVDALSRQVRGVRRWLTVLTVFACLALLVVVCTLASSFPLFGLMGAFEEYGSGGPDSSLAITSQVRDAYGPTLATVTAREVETPDDYVPFPFSLVSGRSSSYAVEYRLKSSEVTIAAVLSDVEEMSYVGLLPTRGSLSSRLSNEQFASLLKAWQKTSTSALGGVQRYGAAVDSEPQSLPDTLTVAGADYASKNLWAARVGQIVVGDKVEESDMFETRSVMVFNLNPATGEFEYVATESGDAFGY